MADDSESDSEENEATTEESSPSIPLDELQVTAGALTNNLMDRSLAGAGFDDNDATIGQFENRSQLDTPISVNVMNSAMIDNNNVSNLADLLKYFPSAQMESRANLSEGRPQSRGFEASGTFESNHMDGFNFYSATFPLELYERVEVINSVAGAMYGPATPAGYFNFIHKRPTNSFLNRIGVGYGSNQSETGRIDLGGRIGTDGWFGYRVNLMRQRGEGYVDGSSLHRDVASAAVDVHFTDKTVLEVNADHYAYQSLGFPGSFSYSNDIDLPNAKSTRHRGFGQHGAGMRQNDTAISLLLKHQLTDNWKFSIGRLWQITHRTGTTVSNTFIDNAGDYTSKISVSDAQQRFYVISNRAALNGAFDLGPTHHEVVLALNSYGQTTRKPRYSSTSYTLGTANLDDPQTYDKVTDDYFVDGSRYKSAHVYARNLIMSDMISLSDWSLMGSYTHSWMRASSWSTSGARSSRYTEEGDSYNLALSYKPTSMTSLYVAYAKAVQQGGTASSEDYVNYGETLSPVISREFEAGAKLDTGRFHASLTVFRIKRPFAYAGDDMVYRVQGNQVNRGVELFSGGGITENLHIFGGGTFMLPELRDAASEAVSNKRVVGVPKFQANLLAEYSIKQVPGLVLRGNIHHTGKRAANDTNTAWADAYTTFDIGSRYTLKLFDRTITMRVDATNLTDRHYWASIRPGSTNGTSSKYTAYMGEPRQVKATINIDL